MRFTILTDVRDSGVAADSGWPDLLDSIREHRITPDKESSFLFSPAVWEHGAPQRTDDYVTSISFGVLDYDHLGSEEATALWHFLHTKTCEWVLYTTFSHGAMQTDSARKNYGQTESFYRVLVRFSVPIPGKEWAGVWPRFASDWSVPGKVVLDTHCKNVGRLYYQPTAPPDRASLAFYHHHPGTILDPTGYRGSLGERVSTVVGPRPQAPALLVTGKPITRGSLETLAKRLERRKTPAGEALRRVLDGEAWSSKGDRDQLLYQMAGDLAREFPTSDMRQMVEFFTLSVDRVNSANPEDPIDLATVLEKLLRRQQEIQAENAAKEQTKEAERETRIRSAFREIGIDRAYPYTAEELEDLATVSGVTITEFVKRWVIQASNGFYFMFRGKYYGPVGEGEAGLAARKYLAPAPLDLDARDALGRIKPRSIQEIASEYGTHALHVVADMTTDVSWFDASTSTMIEAPAPLRPLRAVFHPEIDLWLQVLAGRKYETLLDWIAWILELDQPCVALYLQGYPGSGKSLLATGLARIWTTDAVTTADQAFGNFNEGMSRCPLVFADERLPKDAKGNTRTTELREFIQQRQRPLSRKFRADATLKGSTRLIIAANNKTLIQSHETLTPDDIQAIADRILHIATTSQAAEYLAGQDKSQWVDGDWIAEHALWLTENRTKDPNPPRFLISTGRDGFALQIATGTVIGAAVAHWLLMFLEDPQKLWGGKPIGSLSRGLSWQPSLGFLVSPTVLVEHWKVYRTNVDENKATIRNIALALQAISKDRIAFDFYGTGKLRTAHVVRVEDLTRWAEEHGYSPGEVLHNLGRLSGNTIGPAHLANLPPR